MSKQRLEAFSDGVIAIIITVMVLEMREPQGAGWAAANCVLWQCTAPVVTCRNPPTAQNWAIGCWGQFVGDGHFERHEFLSFARFHYISAREGRGVAQLIDSVDRAYRAAMAKLPTPKLTRALIALHGSDSALATALGSDFKGKVSVVLYLAAIPLAFVRPWLACAVYVMVAVVWLIPDRRIEAALAARGS